MPSGVDVGGWWNVAIVSISVLSVYVPTYVYVVCCCRLGNIIQNLLFAIILFR